MSTQCYGAYGMQLVLMTMLLDDLNWRNKSDQAEELFYEESPYQIQGLVLL